MDISLGRVIEAARQRQAALTPEVAGYIILLVAQQVATHGARVDADGVLLVETGGVLVRPRTSASEREADAGLRALLARLIALSVSPPPAIRAVAERPATGELSRLVAELSASLIPINHAAARRALARLYRETRRARQDEPRASPPPPAAPGVAAQVNELEIEVVLETDGVASEPPPPSVREALSAREAPSARDTPAARQVPSAHEAPRRDSPPPDGAARFVGARSDVRQLLDAFLADTRSVRDAVCILREMIGLELRPSHSDETGIEGGPAAAVPP